MGCNHECQSPLCTLQPNPPIGPPPAHQIAPWHFWLELQNPYKKKKIREQNSIQRKHWNSKISLITRWSENFPAQDGGSPGRTGPTGFSSKVLEAPHQGWKAPRSAQAAAHRWNNSWDEFGLESSLYLVVLLTHNMVASVPSWDNTRRHTAP